MNLFNETENNRLINEDYIIEYCNYLVDTLKPNYQFSLVFVESQRMHELNYEFREKDYPTDVLTFCDLDEEEQYLGDIIINIDKVIEQAQEYHHSEKRELLFLITHGFLHLLGYDHHTPSEEEEMFGLQEKLLQGYNITREA